MIIPRQVEPDTLRYWLQTGAVTRTWIGEENTYAVTEFGQEVYAKLYEEACDLHHDD